MKRVEVLGSGCRKCRLTAETIQKRAAALGVEILLEKVEDFAQIAAYGVMATPSVVVEGVVVHTGSVPPADAVDAWLR